MKSFVTGLVLALSLGLASATASPSQIEAKDDQALRECNVTNPVQRNPRLVVAQGIATGDRIKLSKEEKCFLLCFLQKVRLLNENAGIRNASGLIKYTLGQAPEIAKYSDVLIATLFQIDRSTKGFDDKCQKAFVVYHQFGQSIFTLAIADGLQSFTGIKDKIVNAIENGQAVDQDISKQVEQYLGFFDALVTSFAKESQNQP
ncbi:pheromone/general odorant binding protein [Providencia sp. PROV051]|uniref:pheromone/general odorant binding protein n=1 Tax=Providencia sp. PROV051 TaxID=2949779 RepID=UPI00234B3AA4|nr:pheromone/general odorant binding protein [Providencia sp. PROV051]